MDLRKVCFHFTPPIFMSFTKAALQEELDFP